MLVERTSVGLDVHARSVVGGGDRRCDRRAAAGTVDAVAMITSGPGSSSLKARWRWPMRLGRPGSGCIGSLTAAGVRCVVAAPSKLQRPAGDRVKTDAKDAVHLARLLRLGEITAVTVPSVEQEAARDLVRAREDCRGDLMRARHRLSKLLLRQGIVYSGGQAWTGPHDQWLRRQRFEHRRGTTMAFESDYEAVLRSAPDGTGSTRRSRTGRRQRVHPDRAPTGLPARGLHADRVRSGRGDRRLGPVHRQQHRLLRRPRPLRALLGCLAGAGLDHQDRQHPRPPTACRGGLAPPSRLPARQGHA